MSSKNFFCYCAHLATLCLALMILTVAEGGPGQSLKLTPLLNNGKIQEAQSLSRVTPYMGGVTSYSGFFTVDEECGNNLFFWFFPALSSWEEASVLLWLNGGPGASSMNGLFTGIGPFNYSEKEGFLKSEYQWTKDHSVLFLDQPVGTGFSFSDKGCSLSSVVDASRGVYNALTQFFKMFPNLQKNKFFITGESFAGHYLPVIAHEIDKGNLHANVKINMVGMIIGSPYLDLKCHHYGSYLYEMGVVNKEARDRMTAMEKTMSSYIIQKDYYNSMAVNAQLQQEMKGFLPTKFNIRLKNEKDIYDTDFSRLLQIDDVKRVLHVGDHHFTVVNWTVFKDFGKDLFEPVTSYLEDLLVKDKYVVGLYGGQLDAVCPYTAVSCVLRQVRWPGAARYQAASRRQWYIGGRQVGWVKVEGKLFDVTLKDCGHFVAEDQPAAALDLIRAVTSHRPNTPLLNQLKTEL